MKKRLLTLATLTALTFLSACQPPAPPAPPAAPGSSTQAKVDANGKAIPQSALGRTTAEALEAARKELATQNISINGGEDIQINGVGLKSDANLPKAEITPAGDLIIGGKTVTATAAQRTHLLAYRNEIIAIANAGMNMGVHGADLASEALTNVPGLIFGGDEAHKAFEAKMEAKGKEMEAQAKLLCQSLVPMLETQQQLAAIMPEFKPYANLAQSDLDDCMKENKSK